MKLTEALSKRVIARVAERFPDGKIGACPLCKNDAWQMQPAYAPIPGSPEPQELRLGAQLFPSLVIICTTCGNTFFLNIKVLGLDELLQSEAPNKESALPKPQAATAE